MDAVKTWAACAVIGAVSSVYALGNGDLTTASLFAVACLSSAGITAYAADRRIGGGHD